MNIARIQKYQIIGSSCRGEVKMVNKYEAPSVNKAAGILKLLSRYKYSSSSLGEISSALSINKSTCLRILKSLEEEKFVSYNPRTKQYSLGSYLVVLGSRAHEMTKYLNLSKLFLERLVQMTSLTAVLIDRVTDDRLIYISKEEPNGNHRVNVSIGNQFPLTEVSYGMWFLAYMEEEERSLFLSKGLRKVTPHTIIEKDQYLLKLKKGKECGYIVSVEEYAKGVIAISSPIFNNKGEVGLVIGCLGFSSMAKSEIEKAAKVVKETASEFNQMYQYNN